MIDEITATDAYFSNLVVKSRHGTDINRAVLFQLAPIVKYDRAIFEEYGGIPFKKEGIFVSIRDNTKFRGLRPQMQVRSFLDLDIQCLGRNFHVKVSKENINIVGGRSLEVSETVCKVLYSHFIKLEETWSRLRQLDPHVIRNTMDWYREEAPKIVDSHNLNENSVLDCDDFDFTNFPENCNMEFAEWLILLIDKRYEDIGDRLAEIYSVMFMPLYVRGTSKNPDDVVYDVPTYTELKICNSVYNYRLPSKISLAEKSVILHEKGYGVLFHNWAIAKQMKASWETPDGKVFKFSIQNVGTVKQNCPSGEEESRKMYEKLVTDLGFIPWYEGATVATKSPSPTTELPKKEQGTLEILSRAFEMYC